MLKTFKFRWVEYGYYILSIFSILKKYLFLLYFKFWGTCVEHAGLLHRYTHAMVVCCIHHSIIYIRYSSSCYPFPGPPPHNRPQCVTFPSLCPRVLIVQLSLISENMWCLVFCSFVSLLRMIISSFIHVPEKDIILSFFYGCIVFHGVCVPHFLYPVYH